MPDSNQIDPYYSRERGMFETEEQYAERMKQLDKRAALLDSICTPQPAQKTMRSNAGVKR